MSNPLAPTTPSWGKRSLRLLLAAVVPLALVAAACGGGGGDDEGGSGGGGEETACPVGALEDVDGPVEITVWSNFTALAKRTFDTMVARYNESQDKVKVSFEPQGIAFEESLRKYKLAAEDDRLPNLAMLEDTVTQVMADSGTIIPGQACFDADPDGEAMLEDTLPIAIASYTVDGVLQPVGYDVYTALVFQNKAHVAAAGMDPEVSPATLAEVRAMAEKLKATPPPGAPQGYRPVAFVATSWQMEWWLTGVKQEIVNEDNGRDGLATAGEFANDSTTELMEFWKGMVADGLAKPFPGTEGQIDQLFAVATNSASIVIESSSGVNTIAGLIEGTLDAETVKEDLGMEIDPASLNLDLDLGVGPFPGLEKAGQGQIGGGAWYLTNGGTPEQQAAAWDFMKWFNDTPQQVEWALAGSGLPSVQSAVDDPALQAKWNDTLGGQWSKVAFDVLANVDTDFPGPLIGDYKVTREQIRTAYERVVLGDGNVEAAITEANDKITAAAVEYKDTVSG